MFKSGYSDIGLPRRHSVCYYMSPRDTSVDNQHIACPVDRIVLNVGGSRFIASRFALRRYPYTRLGRLSMIRFTNEFYFDRNPKLVIHILDLYRTGELHIPRNCCSMSIKAELDFWDIPPQLVSECCWITFQEGSNNKQVVDDIETTLRDPYQGLHNKHYYSDILWAMMSNANGSRLAVYWNMAFNIFVIITVAIFILDTMPLFRYIPDPMANAMGPHIPSPGDFRFLISSVAVTEIAYVDITCWIFFTLEFLVRLHVCPDRKIFIRSKLNILDVILIVVVWTAVGLEHLLVYDINLFPNLDVGEFFYIMLALRGLKALRVLRVCHIMSRHEYMKVMTLSLHATLYPLSLLMVGVIIIAILFGVLMYISELSWGSFIFKNVGLGVWWAFATLLAIGYGDVVPTTLPGYITAILCGCCGVVIVAMPIAIISTNFKCYMVSLRVFRHRLERADYIRTMCLPNARRALTLFLRDRQPRKGRPTADDVESQPFPGAPSGHSINYRTLYQSSNTQLAGTMFPMVRPSEYINRY